MPDRPDTEEARPDVGQLVAIDGRRAVESEVEHDTAERDAAEAIAEAQRRAATQIERAEHEAATQIERAEKEAAARIAAAEQRAGEDWRVAERDHRRDLAQVAAREALLQQRLQATSAALLDANRRLSQLPVLEHRTAEWEREDAHWRARLVEIETSRSWRLTGWLRRLGRLSRLGRRAA